MTETVDLGDVLEDKRRELREADDAAQEFADAAVEEYGGFEKVPQGVVERYEEYETRRTEVEARVRALEKVAEERDDVRFEVKLLSGGEVANLQDEVRDQSFDFDPETGRQDGIPKSGYADVAWTRRAVVRAPDWLEDSPDCDNDPANLKPWKAFEVLSDIVDEHNTAGGESLGNSSLKERMQRD